MIIYADGRQLPSGAPLPKEAAQAIYFIEIKDLEKDAKTLGMEHLLIPPVDESAANRFESRQGFDCILLNIPDETEDIEAPPVNIDLYYSANRILIVHDPMPAVDRLRTRLSTPDMEPPLAFEQVLYTFFNYLTEKDSLYLEGMEEAIAELEDDIAADMREAYLLQISTLRKKLLKKKRYFESLLAALEDMEENENKLLTGEQLRYFHIITNRVERQFHSVLNLRDYVTQVREAYQAQIDISLNKTMKLFTVITAIFLPLTLLVGWYGMNLSMPEYQYAYSYPILIVVSLMIVIGCIAYFKRNKWF